MMLEVGMLTSYLGDVGSGKGISGLLLDTLSCRKWGRLKRYAYDPSNVGSGEGRYSRITPN